ncbi:DUF547 domain-containing protein [Lacinutrix sp. MedPE-SW]|mgnify:FL=1|uniref:DUF547 domain-containing protein n=1 Tax=Lacinutrix sp. MedPE-SW TaxID=1860087 RepID=UPI00091F5638|nr:DUF547 domain-containing protein [Lacinutrix sp. MedPE-SW]OIQ23173.1 MAG: DUF547 domain-containing protein [Lacinutrix sp. MedPE-SW]
MKKIIVIILMSLGGFSAEAQTIETFFKQADSFFKTYVKNGRVAYSEIKKEPSTLNEVLKTAEGITVSKTDAKNYQAFWINAYNLSVIKGLVDNYPTSSPLNDKGFFDKTKYNLAGKKVTLNSIENDLLRAQFKDARFHFVLVCGAVGCPPLINKAYLPITLEAQLQKQATLAINGDYFIKVNNKKKQVNGSKILEWYKEDFTVNGKSEIEYLNSFRTAKIPTDYKLSYFEYNWNINKQ